MFVCSFWRRYFFVCFIAVPADWRHENNHCNDRTPFICLLCLVVLFSFFLLLPFFFPLNVLSHLYFYSLTTLYLGKYLSLCQSWPIDFWLQIVYDSCIERQSRSFRTAKYTCPDLELLRYHQSLRVSDCTFFFLCLMDSKQFCKSPNSLCACWPPDDGHRSVCA